MNRILHWARRGRCAVETAAFLSLLMVASVTGADPNAPAMQTAAQLLKVSQSAGGMISILAPLDGSLAIAIGQQGNHVVHCLLSDAFTCQKVRQQVRASGLYGRVSAAQLDGARLPYTDNLLNILILEPSVLDTMAKVPPEEFARVIAPLGSLFLRNIALGKAIAARLQSVGLEPLPAASLGAEWLAFRKKWPAAIDEWTHFLHGADGNPVARDEVVGPPAQYQWVAAPLWLRSHETDSSVSTLVTAQGRLYAIVDEAPISLVGQHSLPDKWSLVASDAFNGSVLWKVPIRRWGWREWKNIWFNTRPGDIPLNIQKRLVAVGDKVYVTLGYQAPVSELDARTGEILRTFAGTEGTGEILHLGDSLVVSVIEEGKLRLKKIDLESGRPAWATAKTYRGSTTDYIKWKEMHGGSEPQPLDPSVNMACEGRWIALLDGPEIACLDFRTGAEKWRAGFPLDEADKRAGGIQAGENLWIGTMIVADGVVIHASPNRLAGFDADTGKLLWSQPKKYIGHLWYEWKDVFVIDGLVWTWGEDLAVESLVPAGSKQRSVFPQSVKGYDLRTGELRKTVPLGNIFKANHHHRCYRNKATTRYILASRRGTEFVDLIEGQHTVHNWVRSTCHVGMMPANGLQYVPPHPCACYVEEKLNGFLALAPTGTAELPAESATPWKLEKGTASAPRESADSADDWPAFRYDGRRTGAAKTQVPDGLKLLWRTKAGDKISPPIVAAGRVFVSLIDEHHIACLDATTGNRRWEFAAGGRIDSPPAYHRGTLLFGSADGWVYCLRATDGQLIWRFRPTPAERLIGAFGQLESAWPVHGSLLVQNDTAYFVAGRTSQLDGGLRLFGVDPASGEVRCQARIEGPQYGIENVEQNFNLPMGALPDVMIGDGELIHMRQETFDQQLKPRRTKPRLQVKGGFLDDQYFKRMPWTFDDQKNYGRLLVYDETSVYVVRMFDSLRGLDPNVFFTPGAKGYLLFARDLDTGKERWSQRVPVRARAMACTKERLYVAGPPDVVDAADPLGAFEARKGGLLYVLDSSAGGKLEEHALSAPPVFNGIAAAAGRLFLADEDGSVACYGWSSLSAGK